MAVLRSVPRPCMERLGLVPDLSHSVNHVNVHRPVGIEIRPNFDFPFDSDQLSLIFSFLDGYSLARCACLSWLWHRVAAQSNLWQGVYAAQFGEQSIPRQPSLKSDWKQKFIHEPHLRFDGFYYLHVSYWAKGTELSGYRPQRFSYYRYIRFFCDGTVHYALLNDPPGTFIPKYRQCHPGDYPQSHVFQGQYKAKKKSVSMVVSMRHMVAGIKVKISTTVPGAYNRLHFIRLASLNENLEIDCNFKIPSKEFCFIPINW